MSIAGYLEAAAPSRSAGASAEESEARLKFRFVGFRLLHMSDHESVEQIERHNVRLNRRIREYWRKQGYELRVIDDPTKGPMYEFGPGGLPKGYKGGGWDIAQDAARVTDPLPYERSISGHDTPRSSNRANRARRHMGDGRCLPARGSQPYRRNTSQSMTVRRLTAFAT